MGGVSGPTPPYVGAMAAPTAAKRQPIPVRPVIKVGIAVVVVFQAWAQASRALRRIRRVVASWWNDENHREQSALHLAELDYLTRHAPTASGSGRRTGRARRRRT